MMNVVIHFAATKEKGGRGMLETSSETDRGSYPIRVRSVRPPANGNPTPVPSATTPEPTE